MKELETAQQRIAEMESEATALRARIQELGKFLRNERDNTRAREAALAAAQADSARIDWLADKNNPIGNVSLPTACVQANLHSLRGAIDAAITAQQGEKT